MLRPGVRLVLASGSATRRDMLAAAGIDAESVTPGVDEAEVKAAARAEGLPAEETAILLADLKAERVARRRPDALVIGADQLLVRGETWFDKPADLPAARAQLIALRGQSHRLVTAVVVSRGGNRLWHHLAAPALAMRAFSDAFLDAYLALEGARVLGSVGAYRLEGPGVQLFEAIEGDHFSILGLPLLPLLGFLRQQGALMD
jgi:septum formation protein